MYWTLGLIMARKTLLCILIQNTYFVWLNSLILKNAVFHALGFAFPFVLGGRCIALEVLVDFYFSMAGKQSSHYFSLNKHRQAQLPTDTKV